MPLNGSNSCREDLLLNFTAYFMYKLRIKNFRSLILYVNQALENRITIDFLFSGWMITVFLSILNNEGI